VVRRSPRRRFDTDEREVGMSGQPAFSKPDESATTTQPVDATQGSSARVDFLLGGLTCASDATHVEHWMRHAPGVTEVVVNPVTEIAYVTFDPSRTDADAIHRALEASGYGPATPRAASVPHGR
jgi:copper chaperone CopZ